MICPATVLVCCLSWIAPLEEVHTRSPDSAVEKISESSSRTVIKVKEFIDWGELVLAVGDLEIATIDQFKDWVGELPVGTEVLFSTGCICYENVPLTGDATSISDFSEYCAGFGIKLTYHCGLF